MSSRWDPFASYKPSSPDTEDDPTDDTEQPVSPDPDQGQRSSPRPPTMSERVRRALHYRR